METYRGRRNDQLKGAFPDYEKAPTKYRIIQQQDIENVSLKRNVD
jgi:hypothetical protein